MTFYFICFRRLGSSKSPASDKACLTVSSLGRRQKSRRTHPRKRGGIHLFIRTPLPQQLTTQDMSTDPLMRQSPPSLVTPKDLFFQHWLWRLSFQQRNSGHIPITTLLMSHKIRVKQPQTFNLDKLSAAVPSSADSWFSDHMLAPWKDGFQDAASAPWEHTQTCFVIMSMLNHFGFDRTSMKTSTQTATSHASFLHIQNMSKPKANIGSSPWAELQIPFASQWFSH